MKTKLKHIADVQTGFYSKNSVPTGEIIYLQAKHFDQKGILTDALHPDIMYKEVSDKHILNEGDVIFAAKGTRNFAATFKGLNMPAVASTSFFVIRLHGQNIEPDFLTWFINQPDTQQYLKNYARGTSIVSISKDVLEDLAISIPSIKVQETILKIAALREKEISIKQQIDLLKDKQIQQQILKALK